MHRALIRFLRAEEGATAVEYSMIAGLLVLAIVAAVLALGQGVQGLYVQVAGMF